MHSTHEALDRIDTFKPVVILIDISLPDMDGYELVRQLGKRPSGEGLRKSHSPAMDSRKINCALANGFDEHLIKPVEN